MVGTKSRGYSNSGRFSEGEYSMPFFCTRHSPSKKYKCLYRTYLIPRFGILSHAIEISGWDIFNLVRFNLGSILQFQTRIAKLKTASYSLVAGNLNSAEH